MAAGWLATASGLAVIGAVSAAWWLRRRYTVVTVEGWSMFPTLHPGDRLLVRRVEPAAVRTGQVVVLGDEALFRRERNGLVVKRVAALPGDPLPESVSSPDGTDRVPAGYLALLGDNAAQSADSRELGCYPLAEVLGVAQRHLHR